MAWYNWLMILIFTVSAAACYMLGEYGEDAAPAVVIGREVSRVIAAFCVVAFMLQGLEMLQR